LPWQPLVVPADQAFSTTVEPVLKAHCITCHSGEKPKGDFDLSALARAPEFAKNAGAWKSVMDRLADGSMPPESKPRPTAAEKRAVTAWVARELTAYESAKTATDGRARLRRLNRVEYVNTLRDCWGRRSISRRCPRMASPAASTTWMPGWKSPLLCSNATSRGRTPRWMPCS